MNIKLRRVFVKVTKIKLPNGRVEVTKRSFRIDPKTGLIIQRVTKVQVIQS